MLVGNKYGTDVNFYISTDTRDIHLVLSTQVKVNNATSFTVVSLSFNTLPYSCGRFG